jgi:hypothetical protein
MTTVQIHEALDAMLENPKTKNFLGHLIKNYFPTTSIERVFERPEGQFKCVLTKANLASVNEILTSFQNAENKEAFNTYLLNSLNEEFNGQHPLINIIGNKKMGYTGKDTTTYMSYEGLQEFYNWVINKSLAGDKHINWVLGPLRNNFFTKPEKKVADINLVSSYTLGETDSFKKLKDKFKNED